MIFQTYIPISNYNLFACVSVPKNYQGIALLIPGYTHSKSDIDFILSDLRNTLEEKGKAVVQVDLYGQGDSYGNFEECDMKMLSENLIGIVKWVQSELNGEICVFARGIIGNLLLMPQFHGMFLKKVILNPVFLKKDERKDMEQLLEKKDGNELIDFNDYIFSFEEKERQKLLTYLYALGSESRNIRGMEVKLNVLKEFLNLSGKSKYTDSNTWFIWSEGTNSCKTVQNNEEEKSIEFYENAFIRDPIWVHEVITNTVMFFLK